MSRLAALLAVALLAYRLSRARRRWVVLTEERELCREPLGPDGSCDPHSFYSTGSPESVTTRSDNGTGWGMFV